MLIIDSFGKNVYIEKQLVGYIGENAIYVSGNKLADLTDDGIIVMNKMEIGYVEDDGTIFIKDREVGYINENNDFVFYKTIGQTLLGGK
jgi:hypothetical protein